MGDRARRQILGALFVVGAGAAWLGCGSDPATATVTPTTPTPDAGDAPDASLPPPLADAGQPLGFGDASTDPCNGVVTCSADLHTVLDCKGKPIKTCADGQGCGAGACVTACDAARANRSSVGCDYYPHNPISLLGVGCYAVYLANTWDTPVAMTAEANGVTLDVTSHAYLPSGSGTTLTYAPLPDGKIPPGKVAILFLRSDVGGGYHSCPRPAVAEPTAGGDPGAGAWTDPNGGGAAPQALHLVTSAPVTAYDILPYGGGDSAVTSATLLLPTSTWDTNYIGVVPVPQAMPTPGKPDDKSSFTAFAPALVAVAAEDATDVTVATSTATTYHLAKKGQVLRLPGDLTGAVISSTKPVGVWGEDTCIDIDGTACDGAHQQIPPVRSLGSEYVGLRYRNRVDGQEESPPWRLVGVVDDTALTYEPAAPAGAPTALKRGQSVVFHAPGPFVVKSQDDKHPFYFNAYMSGGGAMNGRGDPEWVNVVPAQQYLGRYDFFADPTYPETNLLFVRAKTAAGTFADVKLDCAGTLTGWQPLGTDGKYEFVRFDLSRHAFQAQGACNNGAHEASSDGRFGLTVWGWGSEETGGTSTATTQFTQYVSYAYPAGASVQSINTVVVPPTPR